MGECSLDCARYSYIYQISSAASHPVILWFQHWLVYLDAYCFRHKRYARWNVEKICQQISDIRPGPQVIQNGDVWISCSSYTKLTKIDRMKRLVYAYNLQGLIVNVLLNEKNGYSIFRDNCKIYKENVWNYLSNSLI